MLHENGHPQSLSLLCTLNTSNAILIGLVYVFMNLKKKESEKELSIDDAKAKRNMAIAYGMLTLLRMTTNMQSTRMTRAYNTQMTAMTLPFFTALLAKFTLGEKIHWSLAPAVTITLIGSMLVLYGQGAFSSNEEEESEAFTNEDRAGIALQLLSVLFSAVVKIAFKKTE